MKKALLLFLLLALGILFFFFNAPQADEPIVTEDSLEAVPSAATSPMVLLSPAFENGGVIPQKYTCDGANVNPPFEIKNVPSEAKSLVLVFDDPDIAPPWVHWTLWNISATTTEIFENSVPRGAIEGRTSFKNNRYGGSCPPRGIHHYSFRLYALDLLLELPPSANVGDLMSAMEGSVLQISELIGLYSRK